MWKTAMTRQHSIKRKVQSYADRGNDVTSYNVNSQTQEMNNRT